jgi:hypothetical protein
MSLVKKFSAVVLDHPKFRDQGQVQDPRVVIFANKRPFPIRLDLYIDHVLDQLSLPDEILIFTFMLVEKYLLQDLLNPLNLHKIIFTALTTCLKFVINPWISNKKLEQIGGLRNGTLSAMEFSLLNFLNWKLEFKHFKQVKQKLLSFIEEDSINLEETEEESEYFEENNLNSFSELTAFFPLEVLNSN